MQPHPLRDRRLNIEMKGFMEKYFIYAFLIALLIALLRHFFEVVEVEGASMASYLKDGQQVLIVKHVTIQKLKKGDVIIIKFPHYHSIPPSLTSNLYIKRVAGVGGDEVEIDLEGVNQDLFPYMEYRHGEKFIVPEDNIFVLSDNILLRGNDSLTWGLIPYTNFYGRVYKALQ